MRISNAHERHYGSARFQASRGVREFRRGLQTRAVDRIRCGVDVLPNRWDALPWPCSTCPSISCTPTAASRPSPTTSHRSGSGPSMRPAPTRSMPASRPWRRPLRAVEVHDVGFAGYGGHPVQRLAHAAGGGQRTPAAGGRVRRIRRRPGLPHTHLLHACAGYAHFVMDTRGQGAGWGGGDTPDPAGSEPSLPGFMTRGIEDPERLLLPARVHGRGPRGGSGPLTPAHGRRAHRGDRHQPGRRHRPGSRRTRAGPGGRRAATYRSSATSPAPSPSPTGAPTAR